MEFTSSKEKYVIENGLIKTYDKKGLAQVIVIKSISWIWNTARDNSLFNAIKRLEIHTNSKDNPLPIYVDSSEQAEQVLEEIYKYL